MKIGSAAQRAPLPEAEPSLGAGAGPSASAKQTLRNRRDSPTQAPFRGWRSHPGAEHRALLVRCEEPQAEYEAAAEASPSAFPKSQPLVRGAGPRLPSPQHAQEPSPPHGHSGAPPDSTVPRAGACPCPAAAHDLLSCPWAASLLGDQRLERRLDSALASSLLSLAAPWLCTKLV